MQLGTKHCILAFLEYKDLGHKGPFTFLLSFYIHVLQAWKNLHLKHLQTT